MWERPNIPYIGETRDRYIVVVVFAIVFGVALGTSIFGHTHVFKIPCFQNLKHDHWCTKASRQLLAGEVALEAPALVSCVFPLHAASYCAFCIRRQPVDICSGCDLVGYCSQRCREADSPDHGVECRAIRSLSGCLREADSDVWHQGNALLDALLVARIARAELLKDSGAALLASPFMGRPNVLRAMLKAPSLKIPVAIAEATLATASEFPGLLPESWKCRLNTQSRQANLERLVAILMQLQINAICVLEHMWFEPVGEALFVNGALANHSCAPNCQFMTCFGGEGVRPVLKLRCLRDIAPGEDLTVSYDDQARPVWERRARLESSHWFLCKCARCLEDRSNNNINNNNNHHPNHSDHTNHSSHSNQYTI
ncbi:unnamed protein product [Polarella glacialis]|uniref:SET domain-containing protein n=1 Tax=Polarella glacialis TaxID=89957 RepID=A0A813GNM9_POLGL|nr:unnamed protein product [Polarella glacialis]